MNEQEKQKIELLKSNIRVVESHSEVLKDIIKAHNDVRERAIKYTYQLITIIGVVAGFGFTAISAVNTIYLFVLGELFLFSAMAFGMRFVRKGFIDEAELYATYVTKVGNAIKARSQINPDDSYENIKAQMGNMANSELKIFDGEKPINIDSKFFFTVILYLFMSGGLFLLLALLDLNFIHGLFSQ